MGALAFRHFAGAKPSPDRSRRRASKAIQQPPRLRIRRTPDRRPRHRLERPAKGQRRMALGCKAKAGARSAGRPWGEDARFTTLESPHGFHARLLKSAQELIEEAETLQNCVGNLDYARWCAQGNPRLFRLEAAGTPPGSETAHRAAATTVEIVRYSKSEEWQLPQPTGWRNRPPNRNSSAANELLGNGTRPKPKPAPGPNPKRQSKSYNRKPPPIMYAWQHTIALLPPAALGAMDQFFTEMGLDPHGRHTFPCAASKH